MNGAAQGPLQALPRFLRGGSSLNPGWSNYRYKGEPLVLGPVTALESKHYVWY